MQAALEETKQVVVPGARGGLTVRFKGSAAPPSAVVSFRNGRGEWLPVASEVSLNGGDTAFVIGYDGEAYLTGLARSNTVQIKRPDGSSCAGSFDFTPDANKPVRIPGLVCTSTNTQPFAETCGVTVKATR